MSAKRSLLIAFALTLAASSSAFARATAQDKADAQAINSACAQDAQTAGCGNEVVGKGLLKCMHAYKQQHKEFKYSEGCASAIKKLHSDRKAGK